MESVELSPPQHAISRFELPLAALTAAASFSAIFVLPLIGGLGVANLDAVREAGLGVDHVTARPQPAQLLIGQAEQAAEGLGG